MSYKMYKYFSCVLLMTIFLMCMLGVNVFANSYSYIVADTHLKESPSDGSEVIKTISEGTQLVIEEKTNEQWYEVSFADSEEEGYISSSYISVNGKAYRVRTTGELYFREFADIDADYIDILPEGTELTVLEDVDGNWIKLRADNGEVGYLNSSYIEKIDETVTDEYIAEATATLRVRSGKSSEFTVVTVIDEGTRITVIDDSDENWLKIRLESGTSGYVSSEYVKEAQQGDDDTESVGSNSTQNSNKAVTTDTVYLRSGKGLGYSYESILDKGTQVEILDKSDNEWYEVEIANGLTGFIYSVYLEPLSSNFDEESDELYAKATTNVYIRSGKGTDYKEKGIIKKGDTVKVIDASSSTWYEVELEDGVTGFASTSYLELTKTEPEEDEEGERSIIKMQTKQSTNLREGPATFYDVLLKLPAGTVIEVEGDDDWRTVTYDGERGYVYFPDLEEVGTVNETNYLKVTAVSGLNLRENASTKSRIITTINHGEIVTLIEKTSSSWFKVKTGSNEVGYVSSDYTAVHNPQTEGSVVTISAQNENVKKYETLYLKASTNTGNSVVWSSSDENIAIVQDGFVYALNTGVVVITAQDRYAGTIAECVVTVDKAAAIRVAYPEINTPLENQSFNLIAITDAEKTRVRFEVSGAEVVTATEYSSQSQSTDGLPTNEVRIFSAAISLPAGQHTVKAYASTSLGYEAEAYEFDIIIGSTDNVGMAQRRVSTEMINIIASFEGFRSSVYKDELAGNIPTVGYGIVVNENSTFYNNLTPAEGKAQLINKVNNGSYTSAVNRLMTNNNIALNQAQFDALVSFSYNVGTAWTLDSTLKNIMIAAVDYESLNISLENPIAGSVIKSVNAYSDRTEQAEVIAVLNSDVAVDVVDYWADDISGERWYKINALGAEGAWVRAGYVHLNDYSGDVHDQTHVDAMSFATAMLEWHHAGDVCVNGLLYRRLAEAKIFLYSDYTQAQKTSPNYSVNTYGFIYPDCL